MIELFFSYSPTPFTDCYQWVTAADDWDEQSQRLERIIQENKASNLEDLARKSLEERFISPSPENPVLTETASMVSQAVFADLDRELQLIEIHPFQEVQKETSHNEEKKEASNSEDSIDSAQFSWVQDRTLNQSSSTDEGSRDFMSWISGTDFSQTDHIKMNCIQGVIYYLSLKNPQKGEPLREQLKQYYSSLLKNGDDETTARKELFENLPSFLGFNIENGSNDHETGPYNFSEFNNMLQQGLITPYTIISFGNNKGDLHLVIVTEDLKFRSLWKIPGSEEKSQFGKYEPKLVFDQIKEMLTQIPPQTKEQIGLEDDIFYMSTLFTQEISK